MSERVPYHHRCLEASHPSRKALDQVHSIVLGIKSAPPVLYV